MRTVVVGARPPEVEELIERRCRLGLDLFDEVWDGEYHMAPAPHARHGLVARQVALLLDEAASGAGLRGSDPLNIGEPDDYRVPDGAYLRPGAVGVFNPTAALVIEVVSPSDESRAKFDFYARHGVDEVLIVDPEARTVEWFHLTGGQYELTDRSTLLDLTATELGEAITWVD